MTTFVVDGLTLYAWPESWAAPGDGVLRVTVGCPPLTGDDSVVDPPPQPASAASIAEIIDIRIFMGDAPLLRQSTKPITAGGLRWHGDGTGARPNGLGDRPYGLVPRVEAINGDAEP